MSDPKKTFNGIVMPDARYVALDGGKPQKITLETYDPDIHKDHLICTHCSAKVEFNAAAAVKDGGNRYQSQHFRTQNKQKHRKSCEYGQALANRPARTHSYDDTLGFRVNLNFKGISGWQNPHHHRHGYNKDKRLWDERLYSMRTVPIKDVKDFAKVLDRRDHGRLRDSVVCWQDRVVPFKEFMVWGQQRSATLIQKLRAGNLAHPVMLYLHPKKFGWRNQGDNHEDRMNYKCRDFPDPAGGAVKVCLCLQDEGLHAGLDAGEPVLALCWPWMKDDKTLYAQIAHPSGIANCDLEALLELHDKPIAAPGQSPA